ncbi:PAS fold protein [Rhizoctonia solani AG-3 Rhs1AP]|uniref:PAS fold protein n=1 Tax=Rhizoctonia solani AG-3 Rhs1AP TaxID=1086054 RepID=X8JRK8_9AGAM|nr:PAS fold protein [Rhizoctonia solani AG-3 Rhs1AP]
MSLAALQHPHAVSSKPPGVFEFTKRKKWADILVSELSGSVLLVLNSADNVLWASPATLELLGWRDDEIIERPFREFLHDDDAGPFDQHLKHAISTRSELFAYVRLRSKFTSPRNSNPNSPRSPLSGPSNSPPSPAGSFPLFELRGHAIYSKGSGSGSAASDPGPSSSGSGLDSKQNPNADPEASCFVIMARPYPSRNTAMLDSFLELKIENERLRQQLLNLRTSGGPSSPILASPAYPIGQIAPTESPHGQSAPLVSPAYPNSSLGGMGLVGNHATGDADAAYQPRSIHAMPQPPGAAGLYYNAQANRLASGTFDGSHQSASYGAGPSNTAGPAANLARRGSIAEESAEPTTEAGRTRKKPKKAHPTQEQYVCVTCGRTDSPEWRKGPLGAKTLCNACGLRWAKRNTKRKTDEGAGAEGGGG